MSERWNERDKTDYSFDIAEENINEVGYIRIEDQKWGEKKKKHKQGICKFSSYS